MPFKTQTMKEGLLKLKKRSYLFFIITVVVLGLDTGESQAQKIINGKITDDQTGETLPAASIHIENTYRGTITNENGVYTLVIPDSLLPATVDVRFLGYESQQRTITRNSESTQNFRLKPSVYEMDEITVTDEDPAVRIMREVIRRKKEWREVLHTYQAETYNRQTLANDTSIVQVSESISMAFWDKEQGHREVVKSRRQTANISESQNFAGVSYLPNLYDDNIELAGFEMVGITHPDALKFYDFKLMARRKLDNHLVYEIEVIPARKLQPLFKGTIHVQDEVFALLEVDLRPNEVVKFPPPVRSFDSSYRQQYNNFGGEFWLPVDMRIEGEIKIKMVGLEFPMINFRQVSQISDYKINEPLPDSLYETERTFSIDSVSISDDSLFVRSINTVPLSGEEKKAYAELDSTQTLEKAFKPFGFLADLVNDDENNGSGGPFNRLDIPGELNPRIRYNRVDELHAGLKYSISLLERWSLYGMGGYSTGYDSWAYGFGSRYLFPSIGRIQINFGVEYQKDTAPRYLSSIFNPGYTTVSNLLGGQNYFDYYNREAMRFSSNVRYRPHDLSATIGFNLENHRSLSVNTAYDLVGSNRIPRFNIPIDEGRLQSLDVELGYNLNEDYSMGALPYRKLIFKIEHSSPALGSDFNFTRYQTHLNWSFPTFYRRRFLPNTLELQLTGGTFDGHLPLQKMGTIDGRLAGFSPYGVLKGVRGRPYEGEQYVSFIAEHNFRSIPFEALGLTQLLDWNLGVIIYGGAGKTWISEERREVLLNDYGYSLNGTDDVHYEIGASLNGVFDLFRIDFTTRLDQPGFFISIGVARLL